MQKEAELLYPRLYSLRGFRYCDTLLDQGRRADVLARAAQTLEWEHGRLLDNGLDHLSLGRAGLLAAQKGGSGLATATEHLQQAVDFLRRGNRQDYLLLGLLARAALHLHTGALADARRDLDEAFALATRCGFRLHEADCHLGYARLALAEHNPSAAHTHLAAARAIIDATGYHRRDRELAELQAACG